jgi:hypothetical protein
MSLPGEDRSGVTMQQGRCIPGNLRGMDRSKWASLCLEALFVPVEGYSGLIGVTERISSTCCGTKIRGCDDYLGSIKPLRKLYLVS